MIKNQPCIILQSWTRSGQDSISCTFSLSGFEGVVSDGTDLITQVHRRPALTGSTWKESDMYSFDQSV